jgi:haloalkane dehalogenase
VIAGSEIPGHHSALLQGLVWSAKVPGVSSLLPRLMQVPFVRRSWLGFGTCFEDPAYADGEFADLFVRPLRDPRIADGQLALLRAFSFDFVDRLADVHRRIQAPTLCIWGERDPYFPVAKARAMLPQFAGGATLAVIPGAKLFPHEDHAEGFAALARPFLAHCTAGARRASEAAA